MQTSGISRSDAREPPSRLNLAINPSTADAANLVMEYRYSDITVPTGGTSLLERFTQPAGANTVSRQSFAPVT